jgi:CheY-like chemotaxis protein
LVAKILVADDNSNIQKMVGLALKDQGIDVVAVGNGEAAVRKISDIHPDLVLADVFMPVRNGYEVCQYVKADSALAHIPVILLVGAFDPLDEQEAQRVGADGVLKKPFVPPDPLISMVKSALARAGVRIGAAPAVHEEVPRVAEMLSPRPVTPPSSFPSLSSRGQVPEMPAMGHEGFPETAHETMAELPAPVKIDAGSQPLAFGSMLETTESEEEEIGYATTARPELERDWKSGEEEEEEVAEEEEEKPSASWRRDAGNEAMDEEEATGPVKDWRETAFSEAPARKMRNESWAPQKEVTRFEEAAEAEQSVGAMVKDAPVAETKLAPAAATPFTEDSWAAALRPKSAVEAATMEPPVQAPVETAEAPKEEARAYYQAEEVVSTPEKEEPVPEAVKPAGDSAWYSAVSSPWDAEVQKASRLASTWDSPATSEPEAKAIPEPAEPVLQAEKKEEIVVKDDPGATVDSLLPALTEEVKAKAGEAALPAATVEAIREEAQQVTETAVQQAPAAEMNAKAPEPSMEDLVAKVLAKMNPEMLQAVTRDILKNVVESMVKDELNAKK